MKRTRVAVLAVSVGAMGFGVWGYDRAKADSGPTYRMARIERTSLTSTVSATGTLSAVRTVQVGTQVSGQIAAIYVDFNDQVKKGQLLARIDPTLQQQAVPDAQAGSRGRRRSSRRPSSSTSATRRCTTRRSSPTPSSTPRKSNYAVAQGQT